VTRSHSAKAQNDSFPPLPLAARDRACGYSGVLGTKVDTTRASTPIRESIVAADLAAPVVTLRIARPRARRSMTLLMPARRHSLIRRYVRLAPSGFSRDNHHYLQRDSLGSGLAIESLPRTVRLHHRRVDVLIASLPVAATPAASVEAGPRGERVRRLAVGADGGGRTDLPPLSCFGIRVPRARPCDRQTCNACRSPATQCSRRWSSPSSTEWYMCSRDSPYRRCRRTRRRRHVHHANGAR